MAKALILTAVLFAADIALSEAAAHCACPRPAAKAKATAKPWAGQGKKTCPCVDKKKAFVSCAASTSSTCMCNAYSGWNVTKNGNKKAIARGGAFFPSTYGETCATAYNEPWDKRCSDATGKQWPKVCAKNETAGANCRADWCTMKWCYVDPCNCDAADVTGSSTFGLPKIYYSYATCGAASSSYATAASDTSSMLKKDGTKCWNMTAAVPEPKNSCATTAKPAQRRLGGHADKKNVTGTTTTKAAKKKTTAGPKVSATCAPCPTAKVATIKLSYSFAALDFTKLKPAHKTAIIGATTTTALSTLKLVNAAYTADHITVVLKAGSVVAEVSITPLKGTTVATLHTEMAKPEITKALKTKMATAITALATGKGGDGDLAAALADGKKIEDIGKGMTGGEVVIDDPTVTKKAVVPPASGAHTGAALGFLSMVAAGLVASRF